MAHPIVEKLKVFGIRHGEKVGAALVGVICVTMFAFAFTHPTIETTPDQVKQAANSADSNLNKERKPDEIAATIEGAGIKLPDFEKQVDALKTTEADPSKFRLANVLTSPEPGAGLIRDMPGLLAPYSLSVRSGRGAITVTKYDLETGSPIFSEPTDDTAKKTVSRRRGRTQRNPLGGMMSGGGGSKKNSVAEAEKAKREVERKNKRLLKGLEGDDAGEMAKDDEKAKGEEEEVAEEKGVTEDKTQGYRWVVVRGLLDNQTLLDNYSKALKEAKPGVHYVRLELQRQERSGEGWSEWEPVNRKVTEHLLRNLTKEEEEMIEAKDLIMVDVTGTMEGLVDPLPFLVVGYWSGIHVPSLVDAAKKKLAEVPKKDAKGGAGAGGNLAMGGIPGGNSTQMGANYGMEGQNRDYSKMMGGQNKAAEMSKMSGGGGGMGPGGMSGLGALGSMGGGGSAGGPADTNFQRTDAPKIMVRALDFSVDPDAIYRYRARIVVHNPNYKWINVSPGVDNKTKELAGPWSDPTDEVSVPGDVAVFAKGKTPAGVDKSGDTVQFEVVRFDPATGLTVVKSFDQSPGDIIGDETSALVPKADFKGQWSQKIDFTSRITLLDTAGGGRPLAPLSLGTTDYDAPARALLLKPDGLLVLRDEARDLTNGDMKELEDIYNQTLEDSKPEKKKKSNSTLGGGMQGAFGGMGNMGGYGSMGGMR